MNLPAPGDDVTQELEFIRVRVNTLLLMVSAGMFQVGADLLQAKALLPHGQFRPWVETNVQISLRTAERFMAVARRFADKADTLSQLPAGVVHELASPSTPDEVVRRVLDGHLAPTVRAIRDAKADANSRTRPADWIERKARAVVVAFDALTDAVDYDEDAIVSYLVIAACERYEDPSGWLQSLADVANDAAHAIAE
jgi:hypothetical protein